MEIQQAEISPRTGHSRAHNGDHRMSQLPTPHDSKVLVIGWDAADWRVIRPLLAEGKMPHLAQMMKDGVHGNISTLDPPLSPTLWTSIATGKRPYKHGIHGFSEPSPDGKTVRPITNVNRTVKAIWNMMNQVGKRSNVVAWWPSHPAEPIDGVMVSNWYQTARMLKNADIDAEIGKPRPERFGWSTDQWEMAEGTVHPETLAKNLQEFRFHPVELTAEHIGPFIPRFAEIDQKKDQRINGFAKTLADTVSVHGAATALMQLEPWDFMAVYYDGIDHFGHGFMKYHPPRQSFISEEDFELYKGVIEGGYLFHDMMLGATLSLVDDDTTVILLSDHGFHPDHLRPAHIPTEPAGPAIEHREFGIFLAKGPGIRKGQVIHGASILDLTPTVLTMFGLPVGSDMDGKTLVTIFEETPTVEVIPSWEDVDGPFPHRMHEGSTTMDSVQSAEAIKQLVELGYIEEPSEDTNEARRNTQRELDYNLAQAHVDGGQIGAAVEIFEHLWNDFPREHRFGLKYIGCLSALGRIDDRGLAILKLRENIATAAEWAASELESIRPEAKKYGITLPRQREDQEIDTNEEEAGEPQGPPPRALQMRIRRALDLIQSRSTVLLWLDVQQAFAMGEIDVVGRFVDDFTKHLDNIDTVDELLLVAAFCRKLDRLELCETLCRKAEVIDEENADVHLSLAELAAVRGEWEGAVEHALTATELRFQNPRAHAILGSALVALDDLEHAEIAYSTSLRQAPGDLETRSRLLEVLEERGDHEAIDRERVAIARIEQIRGHQTAIEENRVDDVAEGIRAARVERRAGRVLVSDVEPSTADAPITVVAGLPRSGTSMMMQMLAAGGLDIFTDRKREADEDNPRGYLEHEKATQLARDAEWIHEARGHAVKIVAQLLSYLPPGERYRVVLMDRDIREVIKSQGVMLDRLGREGGRMSDARMMSTLDAQVAQVERLLERRDDIDACIVDYAESIADPAGVAARINDFLGGGLDVAAMAAAIDGTLRRQGAETSD